MEHNKPLLPIAYVTGASREKVSELFLNQPGRLALKTKNKSDACLQTCS